MTKQKIAQIDRTLLKRSLKVSDLFAIGYGDLGSSIFYALGVTALYALGATPIALLIGGIVFACTALTYAEMTSLYNESGGSASFARHAFNDLISFIAGWGLLLDYILTIAISTFAIGPYLSYFFPLLKKPWWTVGCSIFLIFTLFLINVRGAKQSTRMSFLLTVFTIATQVVIVIVGGLMLFHFHLFIEHLKIGEGAFGWAPSWGHFLKGCAMAMVAYTGIESIAQLGSEAQSPKKRLPRAIVLVMGVVIVLCLSLGSISLSALSPEEITTRYLENPIAGIVSRLPFGHILSGWVGVLAFILLFVAANAGLMGASRLAFNMGQYHQLPKFFYSVHPKFRTPLTSLLVFACIGSVIVFLSRGRIEFLADLYNFGAMLAFFFAHLSLLVMRIKKPHQKRPFYIRFNLKIGKYSLPITAIIGCLATFAVWLLIVIAKPEGRNLGLIWMGAGILMYFFYRKRQRLSPTVQLEIEKIKVPEFKPLKVECILIPTRGIHTHSEVIQAACELAKIHRAKVIALHVLEIPFSMPLDCPLTHRVKTGEQLLKKMEAMGREFDVTLQLKITRARSTVKAVIETIHEEKCDLLVLGGPKEGANYLEKRTNQIADELMKTSPCRVWVLFNK